MSPTGNRRCFGCSVRSRVVSTAVVVLLVSCGSSSGDQVVGDDTEPTPSVETAVEPTSSVETPGGIPAFTSCDLMEQIPEGVPPDLVAPPAVPAATVPVQEAERAAEVVSREPGLEQALTQPGTRIVLSAPWLGLHEEELGVLLSLEFATPTALSSDRGVAQGGSIEGEPVEFGEDGYPVLGALPEREAAIYEQSRSARVYVRLDTDEVYSVVASATPMLCQVGR